MSLERKVLEQLKQQLKNTEFIFNTEVEVVGDKSLKLSNGKVINTHFTIITSGASYLIDNLKNQEIKWKSCYNLYFETEKRGISKPLIGLIADKDALINNLFFHNSLDTSQTGNKELLSVTVVKNHDIDKKALISQVETELKEYCNILVYRHIKTYHIKQALPNIDNLQNEISPTETQIKPTVFLAGDYLLNGSLNAAMTSGERAAQGLIMSLEDGLVVEDLSSEWI